MTNGGRSGALFGEGPYQLYAYLANTGFGFTPSHFLFACAKEKVTKEKAHPASGFRCAKLPSFRHCSEGRHGGPSLAHRSSFGIHAKRPSPQHLHYSLRSPCGPACGCYSASLRFGLLTGFGDRVVWAICGRQSERQKQSNSRSIAAKPAPTELREIRRMGCAQRHPSQSGVPPAGGKAGLSRRR